MFILNLKTKIEDIIMETKVIIVFVPNNKTEIDRDMLLYLDSIGVRLLFRKHEIEPMFSENKIGRQCSLVLQGIFGNFNSLIQQHNMKIDVEFIKKTSNTWANLTLKKTLFFLSTNNELFRDDYKLLTPYIMDSRGDLNLV